MNKIFVALLFLLFVQSLSSQDFQFQTRHTHDILKVKFSPDDRQLISYSGGDGRLCLWEVKSGHLLWVTKIGVIQKANEHSNLEEFYWSVDEKVIITKATNETYQVWDANTGKILSVSDNSPNITLLAEKQNGFTVIKDYQNFYLSNSETRESFSVKNFSRTGNVYDVSHEGNLFAEGGSWGDAAIKITEIRTGKTYFFDGHPSVIKTITYSPNGNYLAVAGSDKNIYIFDVAKHSLLKILNGHTQPVSSIAFTSDGKILLSSSEYELMKLWDWQAGKLLQDIKSEADIFGVQKVTFSLDGKSLLSG